MNNPAKMRVGAWTVSPALNAIESGDRSLKLEPRAMRNLEETARTVFTALGCRDVARIDFRMDSAGRVYFIECNPLPGLTPDWSDLCMIAKAAGLDYRGLIGEILSGAIRRYKERERERREARKVDEARAVLVKAAGERA